MLDHNTCRIFICDENTGGGHNHAAKAVGMAITELVQDSPSVEVVVEGVIQKTNIINHLFVELYNYLLRNHQNWMKYYYWFIEFLKPNQNRLSYKFSKTYLRNTLIRLQPSIIVSVHPMVNHYIARAMKDVGLAGKTKFIIVVTDPNGFLWSGWACTDADLIIVPNDLTRGRLIELGIAPHHISTIGMPIESAFLHPAAVSKKELLTKIGLDPKKLTILLSGGWAGGGAIAKIYQALQQVIRPIQCIILCGHNDKLLVKMKKLKEQSELPTAVLTYTESLSSLMSACDLLVTKGGGLTTFEAIARRLPMAIDLLTESMPQEIGTVNMLIEANLAKPLTKVEDIVPIVESLKIMENRESQALPTVHNLDRTDAIYDIAKTILSFYKPIGK
jgi:UDP-N-acetylglucosamine:LPS N-acetylglucosamine transferase